MTKCDVTREDFPHCCHLWYLPGVSYLMFGESWLLEGFPIFITFIGLLPGVCVLMHCEGWLPTEGFSTSLLPCVRSLMINEVISHSFLTFCTFKGVPSSMGSLVYSEGGFHTERFITFIAFIVSLLCEFSDGWLGLIVTERFHTFITLLGLLPSVYSLMFNEVISERSFSHILYIHKVSPLCVFTDV